MARENKTGEAANSQEDLLARWSRRKLDAKQNDTAAAGNEAAASVPLEPPPAEPERVLTDADMPPIETLDESSDFSPFMSPGVSNSLRQIALRKLFSHPVYNITDGLNDYDEDFTQFAGLGNVITHEMKRMLQRELAAEMTAADSTDVQTGPVDDVTVATGTGNPDSVDSSTQDGDPGNDDVPSS